MSVKAANRRGGYVARLRRTEVMASLEGGLRCSKCAYSGGGGCCSDSGSFSTLVTRTRSCSRPPESEVDFRIVGRCRS